MNYSIKTINKADASIKVGITLAPYGDCVMVKKVVPGGISAMAGLHAGQKVISINNQVGMSYKEAATALRELQGPIQILVGTCPGAVKTLYKTRDMAVGITFAEGTDGKTYIKRVTAGGLAYQAGLEPGYRVLSINDIYTEDYHLAAKSLRDAEGTVTIVVAPAEATAVPATRATIATGQSARPPHGVEAGGVWGTIKYRGEKSGAMVCVGFLCFCLPGLLLLACPIDEKDGYMVNGKVYDAKGRLLGTRANVRFEPHGAHRQ